MRIVNTILQLRETLSAWRTSGQRIAFVPTMGNLHAGHLKLVEVALQKADKVVTSIFVNPTQFGAGEDFSAYPRTEAEDCQRLTKAGTDLLFLPPVSEIYPGQITTFVNLYPLSTLLCGAFRPGHFDGVATIVCKLFNIMQPDVAVFGLKDYQQFLIIRTMVNDLNIPVELYGVDTVREANGLAMSSRNGYLSPEELAVAPKLYHALCRARDEVLKGHKSFEFIERQAKEALLVAGFKPDYFTVCNAEDLMPASPEDTQLAILTAARLGQARLIDNVLFDIKK